MYRKRKLESEQEIALMQQQFDSTLLQNTVAIQRETMAQIGQEIHDNVGQKLTLASLYVQQQLMQGISNTERLSDIATFIDDSLQDLRLLSKTLSNEAYTEAVFSSLIITTCDAVSKLGKCKVLHQIEDIGPLLSASHRQVLLRVLQEFLQNSVRHAQCSLISVECKKTTDSVTLHLQDNGIGFDVTAPPKNGAGIQNMQARVTQIGGKVVLTSVVGKGTSLLVTLNLKNRV